MRILIAGATGVVGRELTKLALDSGHQVIALSRSGRRTAEQPGLEHRVADALDREQVIELVAETRPDAIVDLLTAIPAEVNPRRFARDFGPTSLLRTRGTDNLLAAAERSGVERIVAESIAFGYEPSTGLASEPDPLWRKPPKQFAPALAAVSHKERAVQGAGGVVLRLGHLCGEGTAFGPGGSMLEALEAGKLPIVGGGGAVFSFLHFSDAAEAFLMALKLDGPALFNVVDDHPAPAREWIPELAAALGVRAPRSVPALLARPAIGGFGVAYMMSLRRASNQAIKEQIGWAPQCTWRQLATSSF